MTGGNSGIGVETVKALATAGSRVVLTSRSVEAGRQVAEQLKSEGVKVSAPSSPFGLWKLTANSIHERLSVRAA